MTRCLSLLLAALVVTSPIQLAAQEADESYAALQVQDLRLAAIAERILGANVDLCRQTMPLTGMILHSADQYSQPQEQWFANGNVAIAGVVAGSAADDAGLQANDALIAARGDRTDGLAIVVGEPRRDTIFSLIAAATSRPLTITYQRGDIQEQVALAVPMGCRVLVEVLADTDMIARSDGRVVQISYGMAALLSEDQLAAVFAHELAHAVLEHRRRLEIAGVSGGLLGEFGRNRRLARQVEIEADRLSVHLLANAGYAPESAPQFWLSEEGREISSGIFRSRRYPSRRRRIEMMQEEIAEHLTGGEGISMAPHLLGLRDRPFED